MDIVESRRRSPRFPCKQLKPEGMTEPENPSLLSVPAFWPMAMAATMFEEGTELYAKNLKFVEEEIKIHGELRPTLATPNEIRLDLRTMVLRDYGTPGGIPTLIDAPHAGHTAMIADYYDGQSLVQTLLANGIGHVALTDWKSATADMKDARNVKASPLRMALWSCKTDAYSTRRQPSRRLRTLRPATMSAALVGSTRLAGGRFAMIDDKRIGRHIIGIELR
jgi:hypothetical protein